LNYFNVRSSKSSLTKPRGSSRRNLTELTTLTMSTVLEDKPFKSKATTPFIAQIWQGSTDELSAFHPS